MPTEQEIEAAARVLFGCADMTSTCIARAALTAAEEVRGQASGEGCTILARAEGYVLGLCDFPMSCFIRLLALARRGAGQAVPDEAAIRADERERCAKIAENWMALFDPAIGPRLAASIRAAAPKPEDKP